MAVTVTHLKSGNGSGFYEHLVTVLGPSSYATGGEALDTAAINALMPNAPSGGTIGNDVLRIQHWDCEPTPNNTTAVLNRGTFKVLYYLGGTEVTAGTNLASQTPPRVLLKYGNVSA